MEYLGGGLQAELKQETGPWTIGILKTSNIIIIWNNYQYRYRDVYSSTRSSSKSFNFEFSEKLYLISINEEHLLDKTVHWFCMGPPWTQLVPEFIKGIHFFGNLKERKVTWRPMHCSMRVHGVCVYVPGIVYISMNLEEWLEFLKALHVVQCTYVRYFSLK